MSMIRCQIVMDRVRCHGIEYELTLSRALHCGQLRYDHGLMPRPRRPIQRSSRLERGDIMHAVAPGKVTNL